MLKNFPPEISYLILEQFLGDRVKKNYEDVLEELREININRNCEYYNKVFCENKQSSLLHICIHPNNSTDVLLQRDDIIYIRMKMKDVARDVGVYPDELEDIYIEEEFNGDSITVLDLILFVCRCFEEYIDECIDIHDDDDFCIERPFLEGVDLIPTDDENIYNLSYFCGS